LELFLLCLMMLLLLLLLLLLQQKVTVLCLQRRCYCCQLQGLQPHSTYTSHLHMLLLPLLFL
jgi:hypothetical protein